MSVLIVGAGPVGLAMAIELERHGVPYRLVERDAEPHAQSRATDIQARTLEVFHDMGVVEAVLAVGRKRHGVTMYSGGERVVRLAIEGIDTPYCFALGLSQHRTEHILEERLRELGGRVERNVRFSNLTLHDDSVDAVLLHPDGTWEEPRFDWLVGCDGGVRVACGG